MSSTNLCVLLIFVVTFQALVVEAALPACSTATPPVCGIDNADLCSGATPNLCLCNVNYVESGTTCALIATCTTAADDCGTATTTGTACTTGTPSECSCLANFEKSAANPTTTCTQITCASGTENKCTDEDRNSYCPLPATDCACKINFDGAGKANCERITCENDGDCTLGNSACHTGTNAGCGCNALYTADATTGACSTQKTCTVANVTADCGTNTVCEQSGSDWLCLCQSNYKATATGCVQKTCTGTDTANCDANSQCSSDKCACADNFVTNGHVCATPATTTALTPTTTSGCEGIFCNFSLLMTSLLMFFFAGKRFE